MKPELTYQKLRGGYYTPKALAKFLSDWAIELPNSRILEPSCGDGVFLETAVQTLKSRGVNITKIGNQIEGVEIDSDEAFKASQQLMKFGVSNPKIHIGDFFSFCKNQVKKDQLFDVVIGNPPFIRYQNFTEEHRTVAFELMRQAGLNPNRLTNAWLAFLVASTLLLNKHGRLAMVIPAELFQVNYAAETRQFLSDFFKRITLITFRNLIFDGIQQEVVLFLGERNRIKNEGIRTIELNSTENLDFALNDVFSLGNLKPINHSTEKWTQYFLNKEEILFLRSLKTNQLLTTSGEVMQVDVGIVTGENKFFILNEEEVINRKLKLYVQSIVSRSGHLQGAIFSKKDWIRNSEKQFPAFIFTPPNKLLRDIPSPARSFITEGEEKGVNKGYKCSIRKQWYIVPSIWTPDAFMLRQVHGYPKIILNKASVTCTDTIHRVRFINNVDAKAVTSAFMNSLTFAFAEVTGRSYGGGVLTFEPSEAENLPLPLLGANNLDLKELDKVLRLKGINAVLDITDKILLIEGLGLNIHEVNMLRGIWEKLRDRRINRKQKVARPILLPKQELAFNNKLTVKLLVET